MTTHKTCAIGRIDACGPWPGLAEVPDLQA